MSTKAFKQEKIEAMKENFAKAKVAVVTEYRGLSVEEITRLRRALQKENSDYMVTKNTLAKVAAKGTDFEVLADVLKGPVAIAFGFADEVAPAKVLTKFIKEAKKGQIIAAALDGKLLDAKETQVLANLPSKEELYAKMLGSINSPATGIVGAVNAVMSGLVRAMDQVAKQKSA
ncbi:MAG: 50S ribosomal protein L10 [Cyanobacteria bacterium SIG29]|nr:50S ribosomal protein L10 [Cyanobacteria bacterium SIG29]